MIGLVGLDDGEVGHDVLGGDRVGLWVLIEDVNLALGVRDLELYPCLLYTSPSPRDLSTSRMPSSA